MSWSQIKLWAHSTGTPSRYSCLTLSLSTKEENLQAKFTFLWFKFQIFKTTPVSWVQWANWGKKKNTTERLTIITVSGIYLSIHFSKYRTWNKLPVSLRRINLAFSYRQTFLSKSDITLGNVSYILRKQLLIFWNLAFQEKYEVHPSLVKKKKKKKNNVTKPEISPKQTYWISEDDL